MYYDIVPGYIDNQDKKIIKILSTMVPEKGTIVEVGSHFGKSAIMWAEHSHPSVSVLAIDHWNNDKDLSNHKNKILNNSIQYSNLPFDIDYCLSNRYETFLYYTKNYPKIKSIVSMSPPNPKDIEDLIDLDLIFLDGNHYGDDVSIELKFWYNRLKYNGIICGDDYYNQRHSTRPYYSVDKKNAIDSLVENNNLYLITNPLDTYLWIAFKDEQQYNTIKCMI